jgi:hypothetical protein
LDVHATVCYNQNFLNPYGGYTSGVAIYEPENFEIKFYQQLPHFSFLIKFEKPARIPSLPPRRIPTWLSNHTDYQYNNAAKLIRDITPEVFGKKLILQRRHIREATYYFHNPDYQSGLP